MIRAACSLLAAYLCVAASAHAQGRSAQPPIDLTRPILSFALDLCLVTGPTLSADPPAVAEDRPAPFPGLLPNQLSVAVQWPVATAFTLGPRIALAPWGTDVEQRLGYSPHLTADVGALGTLWITHRRARGFVALPLGLTLDHLGTPDRFAQREQIGLGLGFHAGLLAGVIFGGAGSTRAGFAQLGFVYRRISREIEVAGPQGAVRYDLTAQPMVLLAGGGAILGL